MARARCAVPAKPSPRQPAPGRWRPAWNTASMPARAARGPRCGDGERGEVPREHALCLLEPLVWQWRWACRRRAASPDRPAPDRAGRTAMVRSPEALDRRRELLARGATPSIGYHQRHRTARMSRRAALKRASPVRSEVEGEVAGVGEGVVAVGLDSPRSRAARRWRSRRPSTPPCRAAVGGSRAAGRPARPPRPAPARPRCPGRRVDVHALELGVALGEAPHTDDAERRAAVGSRTRSAAPSGGPYSGGSSASSRSRSWKSISNGSSAR